MKTSKLSMTMLALAVLAWFWMPVAPADAGEALDATIAAISAPAVQQVATAAVVSVKPAWERILVALLNSDAFITLIGAAAAWLVAFMFTKKPAWKKYEGILITAVNAAEKLVVPEGAKDGWKLKAQKAADAFIEGYTAHYGVPPTDKVLALAQAALPIVHDGMTARGTL